MGTATETCANCGRAIGKLETPHVFRNNVVCAECLGRLQPPADRITTPGRRWPYLLIGLLLGATIIVGAYLAVRSSGLLLSNETSTAANSGGSPSGDADDGHAARMSAYRAALEPAFKAVDKAITDLAPFADMPMECSDADVQRLTEDISNARMEVSALSRYSKNDWTATELLIFPAGQEPGDLLLQSSFQAEYCLDHIKMASGLETVDHDMYEARTKDAGDNWSVAERDLNSAQSSLDKLK